MKENWDLSLKIWAGHLHLGASFGPFLEVSPSSFSLKPFGENLPIEFGLPLRPWGTKGKIHFPVKKG